MSTVAFTIIQLFLLTVGIHQICAFRKRTVWNSSLNGNRHSRPTNAVKFGNEPLCITVEELAAIDTRSEDAQLINAALEHVTLTTTAGLLEDQIYISKMHLYSLVPQETLRRTSSMTVHKRFHELKACVTSPTPCECMVCDKLDTWQQEWEENPNYDKRKLVSLLLTCLQVDTT